MNTALRQALGITVAVLVAHATIGLALPALVRFAAPSRLLWLAVPASIASLYAGYRAWRVWALRRLGDAQTLRAMAQTHSGRRETAQVVLLTVGTALLAMAVARPQWGERPREVRRSGIDVVIAFDISRSMLAGDVAPSRLDAATDEVNRLLDRLEGDRVGLVVFAGIAFVQSPLTSDYGAIRLYLDRLDPEDLPVQGTAVGRAIHESTRLLVGAEDGTFERAQEQVIIVVSDGEDHVGDPIDAAVQARAQGISVYTVGVGTAEGARIPVRAEDGSIRGYVRDRASREVVSRLDSAQLEAVAEAGEGSYVPLEAAGAVAREVEQIIESFESATLSSVLRTEYNDQFPVFLFPGVLLLLGATLLSERRAERARAALVLGTATIALSACSEGWERPDPRVEAAVELAEGSSYTAALDALERVGAEAREQASFSYASGWIHEQGSAWVNAQDDYLRALGLEDELARADAYFALGNALLAQERYGDAIGRFRRALALVPEHAGARRNLEIALLRLYPPCELALDDAFEDASDSAADAPILPAAFYTGDYLPPGIEAPMEAQEPEPLVLCGGDVDVYAIPVLGGATVEVSATFTRLRDDNGGAPLPDTIAPADVRLTLLDIDGASPLAVDQGSGVEPESARRVERHIEPIEIHPGVDSGSYVYVQVAADAPLEFDVSLEVELVPPCYALEDEYESNDTRATAARVEGGRHEARLCMTNADWYALDLAPSDDLFVDLQPPMNDDGTPGAIDVSFRASGGFDSSAATPIERFESGERAAYALRAPHSAEEALLTVASLDGTEGGYAFDLHHYPPCPVGRDRLEPNDNQEVRTQLDPNERPYRFLRLCPGDQDWFEFPLPEASEEEREANPRRPFSALVEFLPPAAMPPRAAAAEGSGEGGADGGGEASATRRAANAADAPSAALADAPEDDATPPAPRDPQVSLVVFDTSTGRMVAQGQPVSVASPAAREGVDGERGVVAYAELPWESTSVALALRGDPTYYHLSFPRTEDASQEPSEGEEGEDGEEGEEGEESEPEDAPSPEEQEDEPEPDEAPTPDEEDEEDDEGEADAPSEEELEREALMQLLDSLEPMDQNLPLQQALDQAPPMHLEQQW